MKFTKMHGLGNDYIYIYAETIDDEFYSSLAIKLSDRHFGIGGDGIIVITPSLNADFFMQIYNADGSKGEMCGNGIRCVAKYVYDKNLTDKLHLEIDTLAGIKKVDLNILDGVVDSVKVDMGNALLHDGSLIDKNKCKHKLVVDGKEFDVMDISMGNPHTVVFVPEITDELVLKVGPLIEKNEYYPNRTNVEFVKIIDEKNLEMRVWERGSGETLACGTGACASVVAFSLVTSSNDVVVKLRGGNLHIILDKKNNHVIMEGPATMVFEGEFDLINK